MTSPDPACASGWFTPGAGYRGLNPIDFHDPCKNPSFQMGYDVFYHGARMSEKKRSRLGPSCFHRRNAAGWEFSQVPAVHVSRLG